MCQFRRTLVLGSKNGETFNELDPCFCWVNDLVNEAMLSRDIGARILVDVFDNELSAPCRGIGSLLQFATVHDLYCPL